MEVLEALIRKDWWFLSLEKPTANGLASFVATFDETVFPFIDLSGIERNLTLNSYLIIHLPSPSPPPPQPTPPPPPPHRGGGGGGGWGVCVGVG